MFLYLIIPFGFVSDWFSRQHFLYQSEHSKAKPKQLRITFNTQINSNLGFNTLFPFLRPLPSYQATNNAWFCGRAPHPTMDEEKNFI